MALTEQQRRTTGRHDLGGDALENLQAILAAIAAGGDLPAGAATAARQDAQTAILASVLAPAVAATGTITVGLLEVVPTEGEYVVIGDDTFEFVTAAENVSPGNIAVLIGDTVTDAANNLVAAVDAAEPGVSLAFPSPAPLIPTIALIATATTPGTAGNVTLTKSGDNLGVSGMAGGLDAVTLRDLTAAVAPAGSIVYNGDGVAGNNLQKNQTAGALLATAGHVAEVISVGAHNILELFLTNAVADETVTLSVREYSAATPTLATLIRAMAVATGADQAQTVDRSCVGLVAGTAHYAKTPIRIAVTPHTYITLAIIENITGPAFCRYQLKSVM